MGDRVGVELLFNSVEFESKKSCQEGSRQLETRCGKESHTRPRGPSGTQMEWTPASGEQERHNVTVITVGSRNYSLCSVSSSLSHATLEQPFRTLQIKWEVKYICKEVFLRLPSCVVYYCVLIYCVSMYPAYICIFPHESANENITIVQSAGAGAVENTDCSPFPIRVMDIILNNLMMRLQSRNVTHHFIAIIPRPTLT